jgi:hypothetical protein
VSVEMEDRERTMHYWLNRGDNLAAVQWQYGIQQLPGERYLDCKV